MASMVCSINSLLVKGVPPAEVAQSVNYRFSTFLKAEHLILYAKYFFAADTMTRSSWKAFIRTVPTEERLAYFTLDKNSAPGKLVLNRTITLKDNWAREAQKR